MNHRQGGRPPARVELPAVDGDSAVLRLHVGEAAPRLATFRCRDGALSAAPDAGVAAALPIAMGLASSLALPAGVSSRLLAGAESIQRLLSAWDPALSPVELRPAAGADGGGAAAAPRRARGTACFFTGGVDSFYTVLTRRAEIDALVFVHGLDLPLDQERKNALISERLTAVAAALDLPLVELETDLRSISDDVCGWELVYTSAALATVAHLLSDRFARVLIPATHSLRDLHPIGSHPLLDPLYSGDRLAIEHVDQVTRVDKLARLAESELAMASLRVCFQPGFDDRLNCGECPKCQRTMTGLRVVGALGRCSTLPGDLSLWEMSSGKVARRQALTYVWENLEAVQARGDDPELELALRRLTFKGASGEALREAARLAAAARRSAERRAAPVTTRARPLAGRVRRRTRALRGG